MIIIYAYMDTTHQIDDKARNTSIGMHPLAVLDFLKLLVLPLPESAIVLFIINSAGSKNKFGFVNFHHTSH